MTQKVQRLTAIKPRQTIAFVIEAYQYYDLCFRTLRSSTGPSNCQVPEIDRGELYQSKRLYGMSLGLIRHAFSN